MVGVPVQKASLFRINLPLLEGVVFQVALLLLEVVGGVALLLLKVVVVEIDMSACS